MLTYSTPWDFIALAALLAISILSILVVSGD